MSDNPTQPGNSVFGDPAGPPTQPAAGPTGATGPVGDPTQIAGAVTPAGGTEAVHYDVPPQPPLPPDGGGPTGPGGPGGPYTPDEEEPPWYQKTSVIVAIVLVLVFLIAIAVAVFASGGDDD